jgi:hypothetical protein
MRHRLLGSPGQHPFAGGVVIASVAVVVGTVIVAGVLVRASGEDRPEVDAAVTAPAESPPPSPPTVELLPAPSSPSASPSKSAPSSPSESPVPRTRPPSPRPALTARYATEAGSVSLVSYRGVVVIGNPGSAPVDGWTLVITLPRPTLTVTEVVGADASQNGAVWTFVPLSGTRRVPARGSVTIRFKVGGTTPGTAPHSCRINTAACTT